MKNKIGTFIVIEGCDGVGKTTHAELLAKWLSGQGKEVLHTKEPSHGSIGLLLREYLKKECLPLVDALLFTADRAEHVEKEINPALEEGKIVICERYFYSTVAYQVSQGLDKKWLIELNSFAPKPGLVLLLDLKPDVAAKRTTTNEKFEKTEFLRKVRANYLELAKEEDFAIIDASKSKKIVQDSIREIVQKIL